ncbi:MAG TPA: ATP-binding protein [Candidatus Sulfotelmatobacter sp.]|jgi:signal transduction histidine kinase|nr:ATP-binding protein [Candidatus Sulfotelmatobacter sp.]
MNLPPIVRWATGIRWQWKVFIPIIAVLLLSTLAIAAVLRTLAIHEAQIILLASVCFALLLCFVLLSVLLVLVERPLEELMDTIARVRSGDLSARVAFAKRRDDIGQLGRQFNEMVEQLERNRGEIENLHRREMGRAEHLATLGELAAGLAHEIRNPLAGIAGVVDVMGKELPAESSSRTVLVDVQNEILHIQNILNDLLSYARPRPPTFHPADLNVTIEQAVMLARQQVRTRPVKVLFSPNPSLPPVAHDPALIQQVVLNLVLNGIQAILGEGVVEVAINMEDTHALISVKDNGKGISPDALPKIFRPFFTTRKDGTGLGLSLASGIVQSHGGKIEASSIPGQGTQFRIHLPIERPKTDLPVGAGRSAG